MSETRFLWRHDCLTVGATIVGCISQGASGDWFAYGCMNDWEDTPLGSFEERQHAKNRVLDWAENHL